MRLEKARILKRDGLTELEQSRLRLYLIPIIISLPVGTCREAYDSEKRCPVMAVRWKGRMLASLPESARQLYLLACELLPSSLTEPFSLCGATDW